MSFGDPLDDFNRRDAEEAAWLKSLPHCEDCGEPIQDEYYYNLDGEILCEDCMKDRYRVYNQY